MALLNGVKIEMGGREFILPPLTLGVLKRMGSRLSGLTKIEGVPDPETIDLMADIIHASMVRNYPEVTKEEVLDLVDLGNLQQTFMAVLGNSGLVPKNNVQVEPISP